MNSLASLREDGASAVEYSFIVAAIAAIIVALLFAIGAQTGAMFAETCDSMDSQYPAGTASCN